MKNLRMAISRRTCVLLRAVPRVPLILLLSLALVMAASVAVPAPASAAIAQRGTATTGTTTGTSLTIAKPTGIEAGDVLLVSIAQVGNSSTNPTSSGWTMVSSATLSNNNPRSRGSVMYRVADGTEGATFTFTLGSGTNGAVGSIVAFSGVDTTGATPFDVTPGAILVANGTTVGATGITTASGDAAVIMFGMSAYAPTFSGWTTTSPGSLTELYDSQKATGNTASVGAAWATKATAGDTGAGAATLSSRQRNGGLLIALKPVGNPVPATTGISPTAKTVGDAGFTLTVDGTGFVNGSVVRLDDSDRATTWVSSTQLTAVIPASDLTAAGSKSITVFNPAPAGGTSNAQTMMVDKATPVIAWENPADIVYGTALSSTELCATASVPGTFVYTPDSGTVLGAGSSQLLHVEFTPADTASYNNTSRDVAINVNAAGLTITANDGSKAYGDTLTFAGTEFATAGLVDSDTVSSVTLTSAGAASGAAAGTYPIVPSAPLGTGLENYSITYANGTLTVSAGAPAPAAWSATTSGTHNLFGTWGRSSSDVYAVGNWGVIQHFEGSSTSTMASGTTAHLRGVWGSAAADVFAVGTGGTIRHYDGTAWSAMDSGTIVDLHAIWGTSGSDVFAVGVGGIILHYDGATWSAMNSGTPNWLRAVWGTSGSDVFSVGSAGTILHYDGSAWSTMASPTTRNLYGIWGTSGSDIFVVGATGSILHYNGGAWGTMTSGTTSALQGVWGTSGSDVFAVGYAGAVRHYNGSAWGAMTSGTTNTLTGVWGCSSTEVVAVGYSGSILYYHEYVPPVIYGASPSQGGQGATLNVIVTGTNLAGTTSVSFGSGITVNTYSVNSNTQITVNVSISTLAALGARDVSVTAPGSSAVKIGAFSVCLPTSPAWSAVASGSTTPLYSIWGSSASNVFAVGDNGTIVRYNGTTWSPMTSGTTRYLRGIWGSSASDIFAVGTGGTILRYDGVAWGTMTSGTTSYLYGIWGASASDVFAVGNAGTILHYDGSAWSPMASGSTSLLLAVWGNSGSDVFAVGDSGVVLHYDGSAWSAMSSGTTRKLCGVWGTSGSDVFAVGVSGIALHYDGSSWSAMTTGTGYTLYAIWGGSGSDVYAVGNMGVIRRYDGSSWSAITSGTTNILLSIWGNSSTSAFTSGQGGTILRHYEYPAPAVSSVVPGQGSRGSTLNVTINGANLTGATSVSFGSGITLNSYTVNGDTQITVNVTIDGSATVGSRDVTVTTMGGTYTKSGAFAVSG